MKLFDKDNFSESRVSNSPAVIANDFVLDILREYFDDCEIKNIVKIGETARHSENYKISALCDGEGRDLLLRKHLTLQSAQIEFCGELAEEIKELGGLVCAPLKTKSGQFFVEKENINYQFFDFIEGDYFYPSEGAFKSVARALAELHISFGKVDKAKQEEIKILSGQGDIYFNVIKNYEVKDFQDIQSLIEKKETLSEIDAQVLKKIPSFIETVKEIKNNEEKINILPKQIIHSDMHPHNLLVKDNQIKAILDLGGIRISQRARDVAFAVHRLGRQFFAHNILNIDKEEGKKLTLLFTKEYESVFPLSAEEKELMPILIKDDFIKKILFVLNGVYKNNNNAWADNLPKFLVAIDEINYFWPS